MKLKDYLKKEDITPNKFARRVGINPLTIYNLLKGRDCRNSITTAIERYTKGKVSCQDIDKNTRDILKKSVDLNLNEGL